MKEQKRIKVFTGQDVDKLEAAVNEFSASHKVFATQHSTCQIENSVFFTFVLFYFQEVKE